MRVFVTIYETQNLTAASERLFVTQSAVSQALARLRDELHDPLFERTGRGVRPTSVADAIFPRFRESLGGIDRVLDNVRAFDPMTTERTFRLALSELGEIGWLPRIFDTMHAQAPNARVEVVHLESEELPRWLSRGTVDLAITAANLPTEFERTLVKVEGYRVVMSASNPLADQAMTQDAYRRAPRVAVGGDSGAELLEAAHRRADAMPEPLLSVQHFATLPALLVRSGDLIATIPETIAAGWSASWPIVVKDVPLDMPPIELNLYHRSAPHHASDVDWFLTAVSDAVTATPGEFSAIHGEVSVQAAE
ncbi:LysR family transcriptional regulator [Subtercola sp. YIM 133946]|uniref:LysR family transcriptional regulator n=1 Tax=Subtercola sp. YIM 133946 TaxID=3118909 RepID=UPI002F93D385